MSTNGVAILIAVLTGLMALVGALVLALLANIRGDTKDTRATAKVLGERITDVDTRLQVSDVRREAEVAQLDRKMDVLLETLTRRIEHTESVLNLIDPGERPQVSLRVGEPEDDPSRVRRPPQ